MYPARKSFGPKTAMNKPLLVPHGLECTGRNLGDHCADIRTAKRAEPRLGSRSVVRIARVQRGSHSAAGFLISDIGRSDQDLRGVEKRLVKHIDIHLSI